MRLYNPEYNFLRPRYWFGQVDSRPLSVFRIALGLLLLKDAIYHLWLARIFYSDAGIVPRWALEAGLTRATRFSLLDALPQPWMVTAFFLLWIAVLLCFTAGYHTRLATVAQFVMLASIHERNIYVLNGADTVFRVLSFWCMFLPLSQSYSVDAIRARWAKYIRTRNLADLRAPQEPRTVYALPLRMIQIQFAIIYLFTAWLKNGAAWQDGEAIYYALQLRSLTLPTGDWFLAHAPNWLMRWLSYQALATEWLFLPLVFLPFGQPALRAMALILGTLMHGGIAILMSIDNFSTLMIASYLLYFEPGWIAWIDRRLRRAPPPSMLPLPAGDSPLWPLIAATTSEQLAVSIEARQPADGPDEWALLDHKGREWRGWAAWQRAAGMLPLSRLWLGLLRIALVRRLIWWGLGRLVARDLPPVPERNEAVPAAAKPTLSPLRIAGRASMAALLGTLMVFIVWWNLTTLPLGGRLVVKSVPDVPRRAIQYLSLWQAWDMFAPYPSTVDGWVVIPGVFEDGTTVDLRTGEPVSGEFRRIFWGPPMRWKKYESNISRGGIDPLLQAWGNYYCQQYNTIQQLPPGHRLATLEIHLYSVRSHAPGAPPNPLTDRLLWKHWCFPEYEY